MDCVATLSSSGLLDSFVSANSRIEFPVVLPATEREVLEKNLRDIQKENELLQSAPHQAMISTLLNVLSPVRMLPEEILAEIFLLCCFGTLSDKAISYNHQLTISHVCVAWRTLAHSLPRLWSEVDLRHRRTRVSPRHVNMTRQWLSRAGNIPLDVALGVYDWKDNDSYPSRSSFAHGPGKSCVADAILPLLPRCRTLTVALPMTHMLEDFSLPQGDLSLLEKLELDTYDINFGDVDSRVIIPPKSSIVTFSHAPRLTEVKLKRRGLNSRYFDFTDLLCLPFSQLTSLTLSGPVSGKARSIVHMLCACRQLTHCTLIDVLVMTDLSQWERAGVNRTHPKLRSLQLIFKDRYKMLIQLHTIPAMLAHLRLPALESISFDDQRWYQEFLPDSNHSWLATCLRILSTRSSPRLRSLSISPIPIGRHWPGLHSALQSFPDLESVWLFSDCLVDDMYCLPNLMPKLKRLDVQLCFQIGTPVYYYVVDTICSRWWPTVDTVDPETSGEGHKQGELDAESPVRLEKVCIWRSKILDKTSRTRLEGLAAEGLEVVFN